MADISKCDGRACPLKESCWRFLAPESDWQTYANFDAFFDHKENKCDHYWKVKDISPPKTLTDNQCGKETT